jgi:glycosyltransferase involved in cell wall biosynthesis
MRCVVGSETGGFGRAAGVDRVARAVNLELAGDLGEHGIEVVPVHTRHQGEHGADARTGLVAADGPGLAGPPVDLADCELLLLLGVDVTVDISRVHRERQRRDLPVIAFVHDLMPVAHPEWFPAHARTHYRTYIQQLLHVADVVVVTTHAVRDDLLALGWRIPGTVEVVGLGTSFAQRPPTSAPSDPLGLLYVSTIAPYKGHLELLGAFDTIRASGVAAELAFVGRAGWMSDDIVDAIRRHPEYGRSLTWTQSATDEDIADLALRSRVAVVPSLAEGYGLFVDEALSLGLTVVASDIPAFRERPNPNLTFATPTATALAEAILRAVEEPVAPLAAGQVRHLSRAGSDLAPIILTALGRGN